MVTIWKRIGYAQYFLLIDVRSTFGGHDNTDIAHPL